MATLGNRLWGLATSLTVAVILICILAVLSVIGALIPQGMDEEFYNKAWSPATYHTLRDLGLLNVYRGPLFVVPALLLGLNLLCCSIKILKRFFPEGITGRNVVSALYHLCMLAMFVGFFTTFLVSFGGELTLKPDEQVKVELKKGETNWAKFARRLGWEAPRNEKAPFELKLNKFETTYVEKSGHVFVKDWVSDLAVVEGGRVVKRKRIQVNDPLVYRGLKFYQAFYNQKIRIAVDGVERVVAPGEPLAVGKDMMMVSSVKGGTLLTESGPRPLGPYVELKEMPKDKWHREQKDIRPGIKVNLGEIKPVGGKRVKFVNYEEASGLTYKSDPAVKYLWVIWIAFTALIAVRVYIQESAVIWFRGRRKGGAAA